MQSEYAPANQERRAYISGFTGSAGTAVVTKDQALLWTDGRYFLQVRLQGVSHAKSAPCSQLLQSHTLCMRIQCLVWLGEYKLLRLCT